MRAENQGDMAPEGKKQIDSFAVSTQIRSEVVHIVEKAQDIAGQTTAHQTRNGREDTPLLVETCLAPWEYHFEENLFEFCDEFYALYGTSVAREGRFVAPDVYVREFIHPDDAWIMEGTIGRVFSATERYFSGQLEHRIIRRDGEVRTIIVRVNVIRDGTGKIIKWYGANQDITEQKTTEEALRISRDKLSLAAGLARLGPWEFNHEKNLFEFNDEFYAIYGTDVAREGRFMPADVYVREFVHPDDAWMVEAEANKILAYKGPHYFSQVEHRIIRRDGEVRTIIVRISATKDAAGKIIKYFGANQDITERIQAEKALRISEERFAKVFNCSPFPMAVISTDGRFIFVNDCFAKFHGYQREEVIGRTIIELNLWIKPEDRMQIKQMLEEQGFVHNMEVCLRNKSGELRTGLFFADKISFDNDEYVLTTFNDITERKQIEREMSFLDRLHMVGEMAAGIGHEIRNPMTTVRGFMQLLSKKEDFIKHSGYFDLMIEELDRANAIITEFLSLAGKKAVEFKMKNINAIVETLLPLMQADAMKNDKFIKIELGQTPDLLLNEKEIRQIILNLVRNGLEAMSSGGYLTIKTFTDADRVVLAVYDQGKGIEPAILEKIGTPFLTTKDHGTGLGLAVCYSIAARHRAKIDIETGSTGTTFFVRFQI